MSVVTPERARQAIFAALAEIAPEIEPESLAPDRPLREQVDLDSFDFLNVIIHVHKQLGVDIPEKDYGLLETIDSTVAYLAAKSIAVP
jgi:acyl carrier protein